MDNKQDTESDVISKFILPAVTDAGWDTMTQIRQEVKLREGKLESVRKQSLLIL